MHKLLDTIRDALWSKQNMITHFPCITSCKAVLRVMTNFFLSMDDVSVSWIKKGKWIATHHCMPILQGCRCFWLLPYLWSWSCHLLWQQGKCHILKWKHWWILMLFNKWWTLLQQCTFNLLTRINLTTQQNYLSIVHYVIPLPYKSWLSVSSQPCNLIGLKRPLHPAWIQGKLPIIPFLLQHNLDAVQHHDNCNRVPLHYASNNLAKKYRNASTTCQQMARIMLQFCIEQISQILATADML